jgi:hypothetical protein
LEGRELSLITYFYIYKKKQRNLIKKITIHSVWAQLPLDKSFELPSGPYKLQLQTNLRMAHSPIIRINLTISWWAWQLLSYTCKSSLSHASSSWIWESTYQSKADLRWTKTLRKTIKEEFKNIFKKIIIIFIYVDK